MEKPVILCVDDEKAVLDALTSQLESELGETYFYEAADSVDDAWEIVHQLSADKIELKLIICDWLMPRTKGDQFLLDVYTRWPQVALLMLSGHAEEQAVETLKNTLPNFVFVRKPWDKSELLKEIKTLLGKE